MNKACCNIPGVRPNIGNQDGRCKTSTVHDKENAKTNMPNPNGNLT